MQDGGNRCTGLSVRALVCQRRLERTEAGVCSLGWHAALRPAPSWACQQRMRVVYGRRRSACASPPLPTALRSPGGGPCCKLWEGQLAWVLLRRMSAERRRRAEEIQAALAHAAAACTVMAPVAQRRTAKEARAVGPPFPAAVLQPVVQDEASKHSHSWIDLTQRFLVTLQLLY